MCFALHALLTSPLAPSGNRIQSNIALTDWQGWGAVLMRFAGSLAAGLEFRMHGMLKRPR